MESIAPENKGSFERSAMAVQKFQKPLVDYLISGLEVQEKWVKYIAADMLGDLRDARAVGHLRPLLSDADPDLRAVSARALERICYDQAGPAEQYRCHDCMIRYIAEEAVAHHGAGI